MARSCRQEVLWSANEILKKVIHKDGASAQGGFRRVLLIHCMARLCLSRLSEKMSLALARRFLFCGSTVDSARRAKTWLVKILRREFWPEVSNRF
jgi:hypothetical protein